MKRKIITIIISLFIIFISNFSVFASTPIPGYSKIWTVASPESTDPQSVFYWDQTPWLYLELPWAGLNFTGSWWEDPEGEFHFADNGVDDSGNLEIWISLDNWDMVKSPGEWYIDAFTSYADGSILIGQTSFTVVPEPVSTVLFISGGATLLIRRFWKSRRNI